MNTKQKVIVTVDGARQGKVLEELTNAGLEVAQVLQMSGIISGQVDATKRNKLAGIDGVLAVEDDSPVQLPPPDSKIQ